MDSTGVTGFRIIGIRHRVKQTADGEARPTVLFFAHEARTLELEDDNAELDFVLGRLPTSWRKLTDADDITKLPAHHIKWKKARTDDDRSKYPEGQVRPCGKNGFEFADKIPDTYEGIQPGDRLAMVLGGSGDRFAFALANKGNEVGARVYRIPPFELAKVREQVGSDKNDDHVLLANLLSSSVNLFYEVKQRDRDLIRVRECLVVRTDAMMARITCEQRLRSRFIGNVFIREDGHYPNGSIEDSFDEIRANNTILKNLSAEERETERDLTRACEALDIYQRLFEPVEGVGPMIASRIISSVGDIRRFPTAAKLKAFMGVHVQKDGRFPRRRAGMVSNWHPDARQALYLLADQFNRRPSSVWGRVLIHYKIKLRAAHPEPVIGENGKKKFTDGHIHKMALWRSASKFVEWLHGEWWNIENNKEVRPKLPPLLPSASLHATDSSDLSSQETGSEAA